MKILWTLAWKDLRLLGRDRFGLFWVLAFPLMMALLFGAIFSGQDAGVQRLRLGLVDEQSSVRSQALVRMLSSQEGLSLERFPLEDAAARLRRGELTAYVRIPGSPQGSLSVELGLDPAQRFSAAYLRGLVLEDFGADSLAHWLTRYAFSVGEVTAACREIAAGRTENAPPAGEADLVRVVSIHGVRERPENPFDITFPAGILWALIGCAANFGISIVGEKRSGTWARLRFSPLHHFQILLGKGLSCLLTCLLVSALLIGLAVLFFGVRLEQPGKLLLALVSASLFFVGMMAFISVLGRTERAVTAAGWALLLLLGMFGGCMFPLAFMPPWMESLSHASPVKWGILALEGALWRGFSIGELLLPCVILLTAGALLFGVGLAWLTRSEG